MVDPVRILIAEDQHIIRKATRRSLEAAGYGVLEAEDGESALRMVHTHRPDLVLLDVNMPGIDGFEVLRRIRADADLAGVYVVIVSGSRADAESRVFGLQTGAVSYLTRPISNRELLAHVQSLLRIKAAEDAVRRKEQQLRALIAANVDGMLVVDREGRVLLANPAACALLDRPPQALIGQTLGFPLAGADHTEMQLVRPDGDPCFIEMRVVKLEWQGEAAWLAALRNVTVRKQAEAAVRTYSERLEEMVAERTQELRAAQDTLIRQERLTVLGQLAGSIAHELRTPLGAAKNAAYLLDMILAPSDADAREALAILASQIKISTQIIEVLLEFARTRRPAKQPVDLNQTLCEALGRVDTPQNVEVQQDLAALPTISADPQQLVQVFGNLIRNAIQAMPQGGTLGLKTCVPELGWVAVEIADTGVGIPQENLARLFEPLFTTKTKGLGLGLALVKMLIDAHDGEISVASQPGRGSTFTVRLPA